MSSPVGMVPLWLLESGVSDRAIRLFAYLGITPDISPTRKELAKALNCSDDSIDLALRDLRLAGALTVTPRFGDGGARIASAYAICLTGPSRASTVGSAQSRSRL